MLRITVALFALALALPAAAKPLVYEDNKLNFKNCAGEDVSARWKGGNLTLSRAGVSPGDPAPTVDFQTWEGTCASFGWDAKTGAILIKSGEEARTAAAVFFLAWDGSRWAAARTGAGFFMVRVADKDEADPKSRLKDASEWVVKNNPLGVPAAEPLAQALSEASGG